MSKILCDCGKCWRKHQKDLLWINNHLNLFTYGQLQNLRSKVFYWFNKIRIWFQIHTLWIKLYCRGFNFIWSSAYFDFNRPSKLHQNRETDCSCWLEWLTWKSYGIQIGQWNSWQIENRLKIWWNDDKWRLSLWLGH